MLSILSMVKKSQSGLRTMFLLATEQVQSWPYLPTMNVTGNLLKQFDLPIVEVLGGGNVEEAAYTEDGLHVNSDFLNGLNKEEAIAKIVAWLEEKALVKKKSLTVFVTGSLAVNVTGVSQSQSFIGKMALQQLFQKVTCHLSCQ